LAKIISFFKPLTLKKGDYFLKAGKQSGRLVLCRQHNKRACAVDDKEITKWISTKGYFVVDLSSFYFHQPARLNIQALTDCELYVLIKLNYQQIGSNSSWADLEKLFIAKCFTAWKTG